MHCPHCGHDKTHVLETRMLVDKRLRRTRACYCGHRFWTYEVHSSQIQKPELKTRPARKAKTEKPVRQSTWFPT
jgi:transcriptional regulator NrdR family protein